MKKHEYLHLRIDEDIKNEAEKVAQTLGVNLSQFVRMLLNNALKGNTVVIGRIDVNEMIRPKVVAGNTEQGVLPFNKKESKKVYNKN